MIEPHIIRLRGPWRAAVFDSAGVTLADSRFNVRHEDDWDAWLQHFSMENVHEMVAVHFQRSFNWPGDSSDRIELVVDGCLPEHLFVNDSQLNFCSADLSHSAELGECLSSHNRLRIEYAVTCRDGLAGLIRAVRLVANPAK